MSTPRIIGGSAKGIRLQDVPGDTTRPITDRVKESLFNIIGPDILDIDMLDLFGGTGSVGIEALSRGARYVRFLDNAHAAVQIIKANLAATRLGAKAEVHLADAFSSLRRPADRAFDIVYVAPPQYKDMWLQALQTLQENPSWLAEQAWVIVQIHPIEFNEQVFEHFKEFDRRKYGSTLLLFYEYEP